MWYFYSIFCLYYFCNSAKSKLFICTCFSFTLKVYELWLTKYSRFDFRNYFSCAHWEGSPKKSKRKKYCKMNYVTVKTFQNYTKSIRKSSKKFGGLYDASKWLFLCKNPKKKWQHDLRVNHKLRLQERGRGHSTKCQWYTLYTAFKKANRINT